MIQLKQPFRLQHLIGILFLSFITQSIVAQTPSSDTLLLSISAAEKICLDKNLSLLASHYNIDAQKALVRQARLWDNPILNTDQNIYDGKFFRHTSNSGQVYVQVMQLIRTGGKLSKAAQLALDNTTLSEYQFDQLVQTLLFTLRSDLIETNRLLKIKKVYDSEITEVETLASGMTESYKAGDVALKDQMRIKALLFSLKNEKVNADEQLFQMQHDIRELLQTKDDAFVKPDFKYEFGKLTVLPIPSLDSLKATAYANRPDLKIAMTELDYQNHNLIYQKSLAKPDVSAGIEYDKLSSYTPNYVGLSVSIPLPIFNRNQGNILSAQYSIKSQEAGLNQIRSRTENDVLNAYKKVLYYQHINNLDQLNFSKEYDQLFNNMLSSYKDRQIGLLEFIDFMDAYKDTKLKLIDQHQNLVKSFDELNFSIGKEMISIH